jgi:hypothetical protein
MPPLRLALLTSLALAGFALARPAQADPAQDYDRLRTALPGLIFQGDPGDMLQAQTRALPKLQGRWVLIGAAIGPDGSFPAPDLMASLCERSASTLAVTGPAEVTLSRTTGDAILTVRLAFAGGSTYVASFDQQGYVGLFLGKTAEEVDPDLLASALTNNIWLGYVSLLPVGADLILVQPQGRMPDLLARCP